MSARCFERVFPDDLENDEALKLCSDEAKWLWVRIFLYTGVKSPVRGKLVRPDGLPPEVREISTIFGIDLRKTKRLLSELISNGVCSQVDGVIVCRRQLREEEVAEKKRQITNGWREAKQNTVEQTAEHLTSNSSSDSSSKRSSKRSSNSGYGYGSRSDPDPEGSAEGGSPPVRLLIPPQPPPTTPDQITHDVFGGQDVTEIWNTHRGGLPEFAGFDGKTLGLLMSFLERDQLRKTRAWWINFTKRAARAKKAIRHQWDVIFFIDDEEHLSKLMRAKYDYDDFDETEKKEIVPPTVFSENYLDLSKPGAGDVPDMPGPKPTFAEVAAMRDAFVRKLNGAKN